MPHYEITTLLKPRLTPDVLMNMFRGVAANVTQSGGVVFRVSNFGVRPLAYQVRRTFPGGRNGYFVSARFINMQLMCNPPTAVMIRDQLQGSDDTLRVELKKQKRPPVTAWKQVKEEVREEYRRREL